MVMEFREKDLDLQNIISDEVNKYLKRDLGMMAATKRAPQQLIDKYEKMEVPEKGRDIYDIMNELDNEILEYIHRGNHPRSFSFIPGPGSRLSWLGDILTTANNIHASNFKNATLPISIERNLVNYFAGKLGFEIKPAGGVFVSGGSMANLTAVVTARDEKIATKEVYRAVVYISDQVHHSLSKAFHMAGIPKENVRRISVDAEFKMDLKALAETVKKDTEAGMKPILAVGTAGTTNTGAVDDINGMADICEANDLWLHIDGAYGLSHLLSTKGRDLFPGIERADSVSWDAHKLLFQTYSCAMVIVKEKQHLLNSFSEQAEYLDDIQSDDDVIDPEMIGMELTRPARAVKLWITLQVLGEEQYRARIDYGQRLAEYTAEIVEEMENWKIISRPSLSILSFKYIHPNLSEAENNKVLSNAAQRMAASGYAVTYTTELNRQKVIRMCTINPETTKEDIMGTLNRLDGFVKDEIEGL
ncbi:pyridoxal phosphate-dependent decarboxylase family protein [Lacicoccus alkaliphilus]|uniref:Glutamate or tyrosine decarboxylase n=1 Tax=Lacicoccus alkaliphilus DSM 16010 TaxID=1123231 RepID=A0A1M7E2C7_9BACL|nr:aminotransferase class V-fold PLP-dependent enzyme [Salinicoccus alkaliphilus]SHL85892.1 Glutamate or tyrosine decarboxylase [Salinicoccus alkaliphilus DSM 16010]